VHLSAASVRAAASRTYPPVVALHCRCTCRLACTAFIDDDGLKESAITSQGGNLEAFCGGCGGPAVRPACRGSLERLGAHKVHWECWFACNLPCSFCYRTEGDPLGTGDAERLLAAVATAGARTVVLAGGDPSLRRDIGQLLTTARALGLTVEVHTNAHHAPAGFRQALAGADWVGLSLDGPTAEVHDQFRNTRGNFARVLELLGFLERAGVPVIVRTVVARPNFQQVAEIGELLLPYGNVAFWYLLEFSAVGAGYRNRRVYELERALFDEVAAKATDRYGETLEVQARRSEDKSGAYVMITPDGAVYGTSDETVDGIYPRAGSVLGDHLSDLAEAIEFKREVHEPRYEAIERGLREKRKALGQGGR
jgi:MoaA/NifB/PqqE/SkfB family radical SAM enzyme